MSEDSPSWDYESIVREAFTSNASLLDMGTGGGEFLSGLVPLPADAHVTEGYAPNVSVARERLEPLGIRVHETSDDRSPFPDERFDLVINRHGSYDPAEVWRVLRFGGRFITQQVGGKNDIGLNEMLAAPDSDFGMSHWELGCARTELETAGFGAVEAAQEFPFTRFSDTGAVVFYLKAVPWQNPDFTVNRYFERLKCSTTESGAKAPSRFAAIAFFSWLRRDGFHGKAGSPISCTIRGWKETRMEREKVWREFMDLTAEDQRKVADFIASLRAVPTNLEDEPFVGMWSEREDLKDSTEWVRETRKHEWMKHRG